MRKLLLASLYSLLAAWPVAAADLPPKAVKVTPAPVIQNYSFYIGAFGGMGLSPNQNLFTTGPITQCSDPASCNQIRGYPTGMLAGASLGFQNSFGPLVLGVAFDAAYDFARQCLDVACLTARKDGFLMQEALEIGFAIPTINGALPAPLPSPGSVPVSVWQNMLVGLRAGYAERTLNLCAMNSATTDDSGNVINTTTKCGTGLIAAPFIGGQLKYKATPQSEFFARMDYINWGHQYQYGIFNQGGPNSLALTGLTTINHEWVGKLGFNYYLY